MSAPPTGDLKNLLLQLYSTLRAVDYTPTLDPQELCTGTPALYLHLLHYLLLDAFPTFAAHLATSGHDLRGKRDARFLQGCYRVLRDEFSYKPALTRDQFFLPGFAARKIMLVMDVARKVQEWARDRDRRVKLSSSSLPSSAPQRRPTPLAARVQHQQQLRPADISYTLPEPASPSSAPAKSSPPMRPASVSPGTTAYDPRIHWADDHNDHDDNDGPELAAAAAAEANSFLEHLGHRRPESALSRSSPPPHVPTAETAEAAAALVHIQSTLAALDASLRGMQARLDAVENAHLQVADARVRAERAEAENAALRSELERLRLQNDDRRGRSAVQATTTTATTTISASVRSQSRSRSPPSSRARTPRPPSSVTSPVVDRAATPRPFYSYAPSSTASSPTKKDALALEADALTAAIRQRLAHTQSLLDRARTPASTSSTT